MSDHNHEAADFPIECNLCGAEMPSIEAAINAGWVPSYWDGDSETGAPACVECQRTRLRTCDDGEMELIQPITYANHDIDRQQASMLAETRIENGW